MSATGKTILAVGSGPILEPGVKVFGAHGLRTWQLVKPLIDAGHRVELYTIPLPDTTQDHLRHESGVEERRTADGFEYRAFCNADDGWNGARLQEVADGLRHDALLGINVHPAAVLAGVRSEAPMWADFYGSSTIEGQMRSVMEGDDWPLAAHWEREKISLLRADRFSAVSERQKWMMHGQLAALGRMNRHNFTHRFVDCIPAAYNPMFEGPVERGAGRRLRGNEVPADAFVVLWSGGYNAWTNYDVLLEGLLGAMEHDPRLHYVSTGGAVHGFYDEGYRKFVAAAEGSKYRERFHFLGWIDAEELRGVMAECDLALQVDSAHFETVFGTRSRVLNMMVAGLPVLTTPGTELCDELISAEVVAGCAADDSNALTAAILGLLEEGERVEDLGRKGRQYCLEHFGYESTVRPLLEWAAEPGAAPDNVGKRGRAAQAPGVEQAEVPRETRESGPLWKRVARAVLRRRY